jgi:hypothetical protein
MTADSLEAEPGSRWPALPEEPTGNPGGRRPGCCNRTISPAEALLEAALRGEPAEVREVHMKRNAARYEADLAKLVK